MPAPRGKCLIDTNVLIYATLPEDPHFTLARKVMDGAKGGAVQGFVSVQNLAEMFPNLTGPKRKPADSPEMARRKIESIAHLSYLDVVPVTLEVVEMALEMCSRYGVDRQDYFDVQLVATMVVNDIPTIITQDGDDFDRFEEVIVYNPFS